MTTHRRLAELARPLVTAGFSLALLTLVPFGCLPDENPASQDECLSCHGSENWAPPKALGGETDTTYIGVGAHQSHLLGSVIGQPVACSECHVVPLRTDDPGHIDGGSADIKWGPFSKIGGVVGEWDADGMTCSNTYCHGATLTGGDHTEPIWTQVDGSQSSCGSCHGNPPPSPHPDDTACGTCHDMGGGMHLNGHVDFIVQFDACDTCHGNPPSPPHTSNTQCADCHPGPTEDTHNNGVIDVSQQSADCGGCHGDAAPFNPPPDLAGNTDTTARGVGAHEIHLNATKGPPIPCETCHVVPRDRDDAGHLDSALPAEVKWNGSLAVADGSSGTWNDVDLTCAVYCHGDTLAGASRSPISWTNVNNSLDCGSCHGNPPADNGNFDHVAAGVTAGAANCGSCHANWSTGAPTPGDSHIDGVVDFGTTGSCGECHGDALSAAPPPDLSGNTDTTARGVGAHEIHLNTSKGPPIACGTCHIVPAAAGDAGHMDSLGPAEVRWNGGLAVADGASGTFDTTNTTNPTCAVYCHGDTLNGAARTPIGWTDTQVGTACGDCHGNPPAGGHPGATPGVCGGCHTNFAGSPGATHIDGNVTF